VPDIVVLLPASYTPEQVLRLGGGEGVRALAFTEFGSGTGGMVMISSESVPMSGSLPICPDDVPIDDCIHGILQPLPVVPNTHYPGDYNIFAFLQLFGGRQRSYARFLKEIGPADDGVQDARALVLGTDQLHAIVEVVGDDFDTVVDRMLLLTDHDDVVDVRTFLVNRGDTRGFGDGVVNASSSSAKASGKGGTRKPAARKSAARKARG